MTKGFSGFPNTPLVPITLPALFFTDLLPHIDHMGELQLMLYTFWSLHSQEGAYRYLRFSQMANDDHLLAMLAVAQPGNPLEILREALERAVTRGALLHLSLPAGRNMDDFYFINTEKGRTMVQAIQNGEWTPGDEDKPIQFVVQRPSIYVIFEQNIGPLTPIIAEQLRDLEQEYSAIWLEDAIKQAVMNQSTSLSYIIGILKRWKRDGRSGSAKKAASNAPPSE